MDFATFGHGHRNRPRESCLRRLHPFPHQYSARGVPVRRIQNTWGPTMNTITEFSYIDHFQDPIYDTRAFAENIVHHGERGEKCDSEGCLSGAKRPSDEATDEVDSKSPSTAQPLPPFSSSSFPQLLYRMLKETKEQGLCHIVSWHVHGRSFQIHDRTRFESDVMPRYVSSLDRQALD